MSTIISSPIVMYKTKPRPSTPIRRRHLASLSCNSIKPSHMQVVLFDLFDRLKDCSDSSTQLLIRLYHHKSPRLHEQPDQLVAFQQEIFTGLRRLHPTVLNVSLFNQENEILHPQQPIVTCRSAQATIRKLH